MTGTGYSVAPVPAPAPAVVAPRVLTPEEQAEVDRLYEELKPQATATARDYVLTRTPANLHDAMVLKIEADWPAPPPLSDEQTRTRAEDLLSYARRGAPAAPAAPAADPPAGQPYYPPVQPVA